MTACREELSESADIKVTVIIDENVRPSKACQYFRNHFEELDKKSFAVFQQISEYQINQTIELSITHSHRSWTLQ